MSVITQTLYFIGSYVGIISILLFVLNWMTKGWLMTFLKVKASKGKKLITIVKSETDVYYTSGILSERIFKYTTRNGTSKSIANTNRDHIFSTMGCFAITVDESKDITYGIDGTAKGGMDAAITDNFINRILTAPQLDDNFKKIIIIALIFVVVLLIGIAIGLFQIYDTVQTIKQVSGVI